MQQAPKISNPFGTEQFDPFIHKGLGFVVVAQRVALLQTTDLVVDEMFRQHFAATDITNQQATFEFEQGTRVTQHRLDNHAVFAEVIDTHAPKRCRILVLAPTGDAEIHPLNPEG